MGESRAESRESSSQNQSFWLIATTANSYAVFAHSTTLRASIFAPTARHRSSTSNVGVCRPGHGPFVAGRAEPKHRARHVLQVDGKILAAHAGPRHRRHVVGTQQLASPRRSPASSALRHCRPMGVPLSKHTSSFVPVTCSMPSASVRIWAIVFSRTSRSSVRTVPSSTTCSGITFAFCPP